MKTGCVLCTRLLGKITNPCQKTGFQMHYKATLDKIQEQNLNYLLTHNLELIVSDSKTTYKHTF